MSTKKEVHRQERVRHVQVIWDKLARPEVTNHMALPQVMVTCLSEHSPLPILGSHIHILKEEGQSVWICYSLWPT